MKRKRCVSETVRKGDVYLCEEERRGEVCMTEINWDGMDLMMEKNVEITLE